MDLNGGFQKPLSECKMLGNLLPPPLRFFFLQLQPWDSSKNNAWTQKDSLFTTKIQNHPLFSTHPVVYMWIFGASPVAWTKSRPEWNAPEKHLQSHLGLLHPSNHNEKVQWQYMKITENHENPKQTMSSVKHFLLTKNKVNLSYRDLLQGSSLISRNPWRFYILIFKGCPGPPNMK